LIKFNIPVHNDETISNILDVFQENHASGDGKYTKLCHSWIEKTLNCKKALLVHSGTAALELAAIMCNLSVDDEVIMPSYTFVSTANAFVLQKAKPVFVDIRPDTLNIDEKLIEAAITPKTKVIVPVHYAGVACEMDTIINIAKKYNLLVVEDAAQAFCSQYKDKPLGTIGDMGCFSFHETKNIMSGEGGCFVTNNPDFSERAEIIREKGTNRSKFFRGQVDKYTWVDVGSSYLPSDLIGAYLYSTLNISEKIQQKRISLWERYNVAFEEYEKKGLIRRPFIPKECTNNAHMYYILFNSLEERTDFIKYLKDNNILSVFHYIPLHSSPAGRKFGRYVGTMDITNKVSDTLVRLPMYFDLTEDEQDYIIDKITQYFRGRI
jgi:dTDP-4-amino-4,6-dideoxygalactose transaminase